MCGICGFIGYCDGFEYVVNGLHMLLNRGFDSCSIGSVENNNSFLVQKFISINGNIPEMMENLKNQKHYFLGAQNMCGHSRWKTHGTNSVTNAHPHLDYTSRFSVVHNGIIENYAEIKQKLEQQGIEFKSQTDTEVIVNLISVMYDKHGNVEKAMEEAFSQLEGTWGVVLLTTLHPDKMFCARHGSPLLVGFGDNFMMVASEQSGFSNYVNNYICLNDHDIIVLEKKDGKVVFNKKPNYTIRKVTADIGSQTPSPYPHWTIKEINDQSESVLRAMCMGARIQNEKCVKLGGLSQYENDLRNIDNLILLGCGTSYHAGLFASHILKEISGFSNIQVFDGAEFSKYDIPKLGKTAFVLISQSGETKDLYRCVEIGKDNNIMMIGVINVVDSLIAREVNCGIYLNAGREVAVASTKAFTTQVVVLYMMAVWFAQIRNLNDNKRMQIISDLRRLPIDIRTTIDVCDKQANETAEYLQKINNLFIIGKGQTEAIAKEGSLKIKEISYVHSEAYSSSALKHGPLSLICPEVPVIIINPNDTNFGKNQGVCEEIKSRDTPVIGVSDIELDNNYKIKFLVPKNKTFKDLLCVIPLQLIAYKLSVLKGYNPDFPKNLAKIITV
ncbi:glucosamine-fructose-6-phosphate aminotransferase [Fadolivirus algeromassiliense]|jgi:glucosamine--fructose-6-phosphate aminotransferase (isomerizing)|uniref:glutamine--fructose-6-phosphate transaminase (isomerizing) n=1 Tax=Fadolivirus FV1/VV64 TaxID=3070911 RepID=A0A7D3UQW2_9VIRU|nr:glucosamine-fructose-6-phosphate aminotransferase [Fadolivirus algeromassiliense]QKF94133.1 glucosamine-fructose-6-phosphate aminotransferase [Fadolivirus FV1/VV64]